MAVSVYHDTTARAVFRVYLMARTRMRWPAPQLYGTFAHHPFISSSLRLLARKSRTIQGSLGGWIPSSGEQPRIAQSAIILDAITWQSFSMHTPFKLLNLMRGSGQASWSKAGNLGPTITTLQHLCDGWLRNRSSCSLNLKCAVAHVPPTRAVPRRHQRLGWPPLTGRYVPGNN